MQNAQEKPDSPAKRDLLLCQHDEENHCITCSDALIPVRVMAVNTADGLAQVEVGSQVEEVDILLLEEVIPGDLLLVHGGVAIARAEEGAT